MKGKSNNQAEFMIENYSYDQIQKQWISIMPLCHYLIKISDIKKNNLMFTSLMKPFAYTLTETSLAKELYQRFELRSVNLFGSIGFCEGNWGNLTIRVNKLGPVKLKHEVVGFVSGSKDKTSDNISKVLCYMRISIEHKRTTLK